MLRALLLAWLSITAAEEYRSYVTITPGILAASPAADWERIADENLLFIEMKAGTVVLELAPFASPEHVAQIRALTRAGYYDKSWMLRSQENYVTQWGDLDGKRSIGNVPAVLPKEDRFAVASDKAFTPLDSIDSYAPKTGFIAGFPAAMAGKEAWIVHCHGVVGAVHDDPKTTAGGTYMYAAIGHLPRELDGKIPIVGRVISGMSLLSTLPRGEGLYGFYPEGKNIPIARMRIGSDLPPAERRRFERLRTDSTTFAQVLAAKRGYDPLKPETAATPKPIDICAVPFPIREVARTG